MGRGRYVVERKWEIMKIFISYDSRDVIKMQIACRIFQKAKLQFIPLIVAEKDSPAIPISEKVIEGIDEATHIVPIITRISKASQWVNQEIGYATSSGKAIFPLIEDKVIKYLKGFITAQDDLPFNFKSNKNDQAMENRSFRIACKRLAQFLDDLTPIVFTSAITPSRAKSGEFYTTKVTFKGKIQNGFFDNQFLHQESRFKGWQWDQNTLISSNRYHIDKTPGELNGFFDYTWQYENSTKNWPIGKYKIKVYLFSHIRPGRKGRLPLAIDEHEFEIF